MTLEGKPSASRPNGLRAGWPAGFTLVELLAISFLLVCMSLLLLPTLARARQKTTETNCQLNLRQLGLALQAYATDNGDFLPGPVFALVDPRYTSAATNQLAWFVADRIGSSKPSAGSNIAPGLLCPARESVPGQSRRDYVLNDGRAAKDGLSVAPFGQPLAPVTRPLRLSMIASSTEAANCFAISDADKANVNPTLAGWRGLPYQPVHGKVRNQLYFDWHVAAKRW